MNTAIKKLTKAEACAELARRMGHEIIYDGGQGFIRLHPLENDGLGGTRPMLDYFNDRDAAAELAEWIFGHAFTNRGLCERFLEALHSYLPPLPDWYACKDFQLILTDAQQIARAACAALGLEVKE